MEWSESQVNALIACYPENGTEIDLPFSKSAIRHKARRLGLSVSKSRKSSVCSKNSKNASHITGIVPQKIINVDSPEAAYFLGMFWADGWISDGFRKFNRYRISMEIINSDAEDIFKTMLSIGKWSTFIRTRKNRKPQFSFISSGREIVLHLLSLGYGRKSGGSAEAAIKSIPVELRKYWLRGFFDGDGCIYINNKQHTIQISFCGTHDQDWSWLTSWLTSNGISSSVTRRSQKRKTGEIDRHSVVRITNRADVLKFCAYIYSGDASIGLSRKRRKFSQIPEAKRGISDDLLKLQAFCQELP